MALHPGLIGENLLLGAAVRALVEFHSQPSEVLTGTSDRHLSTSSIDTCRYYSPCKTMIKPIEKTYYDLNHIEEVILMKF
jgi:hypothetical protein